MPANKKNIQKKHLNEKKNEKQENLNEAKKKLEFCFHEHQEYLKTFPENKLESFLLFSFLGKILLVSLIHVDSIMRNNVSFISDFVKKSCLPVQKMPTAKDIIVSPITIFSVRVFSFSLKAF